MSDLKRSLSEAVEAAFAAEGLPAELGRVAASDRPDLADFQSNGALAAAQRVGTNPRELAVEVAGPGFINLKLADGELSRRAGEIAADPRAGGELVAAPSRVLIDYGGP